MTAKDIPPPRLLRLPVADDDPVVRAGMVALLEQEADMRVVFEASPGAEAVAGWQATATVPFPWAWW